MGQKKKDTKCVKKKKNRIGEEKMLGKECGIGFEAVKRRERCRKRTGLGNRKKVPDSEKVQELGAKNRNSEEKSVEIIIKKGIGRNPKSKIDYNDCC